MTAGRDGLDRLLAAWVHDTGLTGPEVDAMRQAIVREPVVRPRVAPAGARWWQDFTAQMSAVMVGANNVVRTSGGYNALRF